MKYELYGAMHRTAKRILHKEINGSSYRMVSIQKQLADANGCVKLCGDAGYINDNNLINGEIALKSVYPVENIVPAGKFPELNDSFGLKRKCAESQLGVKKAEVVDAWLEFINNSKIPEGYRNCGLHYAGYILDCEEWCLPSWIWTNAALVRMYCKTNHLDQARFITDRLIEKQQECGGWIVRNDYDAEGAVPVLAPNDSAYVANNACLEMYLTTREEKYLKAAVHCADWIIGSAREDGMVYVGYDMKRQHWQTKHNIVDVGFTAGFFARLYETTGEEKYLEFLKRFTKRFIELFYIPTKHGFTTSLDANDGQLGGMFGRGQAWALEGLIPAARVLKDQKLNDVVEQTIHMLVGVQDKDGGWAYNISRPLMGIDCKATSIIACSLMNYYAYHPKMGELRTVAEKAYRWCIKHTLSNGKGKGGIFSYSTEGAIAHHFYTWTAFVYSSAYAVELDKMLEV